MDTKAWKQDFLRGDGDGNAVYYCDKRNNYPSAYQHRFKGMQIYKDHARIVDDYRTTLAGTTIPDPATLRK